MRSFLLIFVLALTGCVTDASVYVDCGNGYQVRPPLACPEVGAKF